MSNHIHLGPDADGFIDREQVHLLVWIDGDEAAVAGPAVGNKDWVVRAIRAVSRQWLPQEELRPRTAPLSPGDYLDCTQKELAVIIYNHHQVVVERDEIFPGSGLASHFLDVSGYRRHETEWAVARLDDIAHCIEHEEGYDYEL